MNFETLIDTYGSMLWRIASSYERDRAICEELYQEICLAVWQAVDKVGEAESPKAYVARIATNQAVSHVRRELRQPHTAEAAEVEAGQVSEPDGTPALDDAVDVYQRQRRLLAAVQTLPLNWRMPVTLTLEGFKPQEIAYVMGITANTVSLRLTRAKQALRELMSEEETNQ